MSNGLMDRGPAINGKKFLISIIGGLILFTVAMLIITLAIGKYGGKVLNKKAMEHERTIDTQIMRDKEASHRN
jgi:uncharacterized protein (DUF697 family)